MAVKETQFFPVTELNTFFSLSLTLSFCLSICLYLPYGYHWIFPDHNHTGVIFMIYDNNQIPFQLLQCQNMLLRDANCRVVRYKAQDTPVLGSNNISEQVYALQHKVDAAYENSQSVNSSNNDVSTNSRNNFVHKNNRKLEMDTTTREVILNRFLD